MRPIFVLGVVLFGLWYLAQGEDRLNPFDWMAYDKFDEITDRMDAVDAQNCRSKPVSELRLPADTIAQRPRFNKLLSTIIYPNRTALLHLHNMALNRAFFFSYIFQKLNQSQAFEYQPGLMYYYFSAAADVSANEYNVNGSAIFFDNNCSYATWYRNLPFNHTLPLFGPRAWRLDDFNDPTNWIREPTNRTLEMEDYGAGPQSNYSSKSYKINQWYDLWLPDGWDMKGLDSVRKHTYDIGIKYSNETGKFTSDEWEGKTIFGPPSPGQKETEHLPVVYTEPFFDCGRSNKWIVSAVAPVVDQLPRYLDWFHLRRHKFVAVSVQEMDFFTIDINPCPISIGNEAPNYFAGTARCKPTTMCEPLHGWGFRRGGYQCVCLPGYRYPPWQNGPWQGIDIESATEKEYKNGFDCLEVKLQQVIPIRRGNGTVGTPQFDASGRKKREAPVKLKEDIRPAFVRRTERAAKIWRPNKRSVILNRKKRLLRILNLQEEEVKSRTKQTRLVPRYSFKAEAHVRKKRTVLEPRYQRGNGEMSSTTPGLRELLSVRQAFDQRAFERMLLIVQQKDRVNADNCHQFKKEELTLPGDVSFGVEKQFSSQARTALRLSHFLSNFLQNIDMYEEYGNLRGDKLLNIELLFGEALANVMGDLKIKGSGVFFDIDKFKEPDGATREFFGPYAYREDKEQAGEITTTHFRAVDFAGYRTHYLDEPWFKFVKERWQSNTYGLSVFTEKPMIRADLPGSSLKRFELYPMYYRAPKEVDGWWSAPHFDCDGYVNDWVITYSVPFFGLNAIKSALEFKGVVTVDVRLNELDINQCPAEYHVPNAFKNTARCHYDSTFCVPLPGKRFTRGGYKCECKQGYEYPFREYAWYFDGQTMEEEYRKMINGVQNHRFHTLRCRYASAGRASLSLLALLAVIASMFFV